MVVNRKAKKRKSDNANVQVKIAFIVCQWFLFSSFYLLSQQKSRSKRGGFGHWGIAGLFILIIRMYLV